MWQHKKRGEICKIVGNATVQVSTEPLTDYDEVVVYRSEDGLLWVRRKTEFYDGRFKFVPKDDKDCICHAGNCPEDFLPHCRHSLYYPGEQWSDNWEWNEARNGWMKVLKE
jgi:hypothetical protein